MCVSECGCRLVSVLFLMMIRLCVLVSCRMWCVLVVFVLVVVGLWLIDCVKNSFGWYVVMCLVSFVMLGLLILCGMLMMFVLFSFSLLNNG